MERVVATTARTRRRGRPVRPTPPLSHCRSLSGDRWSRQRLEQLLELTKRARDHRLGKTIHRLFTSGIVMFIWNFVSYGLPVDAAGAPDIMVEVEEVHVRMVTS